MCPTATPIADGITMVASDRTEGDVLECGIFNATSLASPQELESCALTATLPSLLQQLCQRMDQLVNEWMKLVS